MLELSGIGNGPTVRALLDDQKKEDPNVLFLSEMKHDRRWMEGLRWRLKMTNMVAKDSNGTSGGLALLWKKEVDPTVLSWS